MNMTHGIHPILIAPCGINCNICDRYLKDNRSCAGCRSVCSKPKGCNNCEIDQCAKAKGLSYCYECDEFPCKKINNLDNIYRKKYSISLVENSIQIRDFGMNNFLKTEQEKWRCKCGGSINLRSQICSDCGGFST